jgi:hypothetical protein
MLIGIFTAWVDKAASLGLFNRGRAILLVEAVAGPTAIIEVGPGEPSFRVPAHRLEMVHLHAV